MHEKTPPTTVEWLDMVKERCGIGSDYKLAELLGVTRQAISQQRAGKQCMSIMSAVRVAEALKLPSQAVIAGVMYYGDRETNRGFWADRWARAWPTVQRRIGQPPHGHPSQPVGAKQHAPDMAAGG